VRPSKPFHILYAWSEVYEAEIMSGEIQWKRWNRTIAHHLMGLICMFF
jgi:hypothetical protein